MRLPDGDRSRAVLIGTGAYEHLPGVPASRNNLRALKEALQRHTGLRARHCRDLLDAPDLVAVGSEVEAATSAATDLLVVYYSGHGLVDADGSLHLALPRTSQRLLPWSGIPLAFLQRAIRESPAATKVLVLDCCFSGVATETLGGADVIGQLKVTGTFTLASSPASSPSYAFEGNEHTAFTGALLEVLERGSPRAEAMLTLNDVYLALLRHAQLHLLPKPQKCGTHTADLLPLARNRAFGTREAAEAEAAEETRRVPEGVPSATPGRATESEFARAPQRRAEVEAAETPRRTAAVEAAPAPHRASEPAPRVAEQPGSAPFFRDAPLLVAAQAEAIKFRVKEFAVGYDQREVDEFLDRVAEALADPDSGPQRMGAAEVRSVQFTATRPGYDMDEVDDFLDFVESEFERRRALADDTAAA